ncbi:hypothetical protein [Pararhodobacter sp.]|uniref:hypothetical protein n=1 Tax=Pararhodobacter sp. TaxID=2127056 RepID=UPI002AFF479E|nr:hypothetical protein [Pararhodobacter sp.]
MTFNRMTAAAVVAASMSLVPATGALAESHGQNIRVEQNALIEASTAEFHACLESRVDISAGENQRSASNNVVSIQDSLDCSAAFQTAMNPEQAQTVMGDEGVMSTD